RGVCKQGTGGSLELLTAVLNTRFAVSQITKSKTHETTISMSFSERLHDVKTGFERPFWVANITELFERLSYYAAFASLARYLHEALRFPVEQASSLTGLFGGLVWFLAAFGGTVATVWDSVARSPSPI